MPDTFSKLVEVKFTDFFKTFERLVMAMLNNQNIKTTKPEYIQRWLTRKNMYLVQEFITEGVTNRIRGVTIQLKSLTEDIVIDEATILLL